MRAGAIGRGRAHRVAGEFRSGPSRVVLRERAHLGEWQQKQKAWRVTGRVGFAYIISPPFSMQDRKSL